MPSSLDLSLPEGPRPKARLQLIPILTFLLAAAILVVLLLGREAEAPAAKAPVDAAEVELLRNLGDGLERRTLYSQAADVWGEYLAKAALEPDQRALIVYRRGKCLTLSGRHVEAIRHLSEVDWLPLPSEQNREAGRLLLECLAAVGKIDVRDELSRRLALGAEEEGSTVLARVRGDAITREEIRKRLTASARRMLLQSGAPLSAAELDEKSAEMAQKQLSDPRAVQALLQDAIGAKLLYLEGLERGFGDDASITEEVAQYRQVAIGQKVVASELGEVAKALGPTEISNHYEAHKDRFVEKAGSSFAYARLETREEANALIEKLRAKDAESEATLTKAEGFAVPGEPVPAIGDSAEIRAHILALGEGEVSAAPIEFQGGHCVFRVEKKRPERRLSLEEAEALVRDDLLRVKREEVLDDLFRSLQVKYPVELVAPEAKQALEAEAASPNVPTAPGAQPEGGDAPPNQGGSGTSEPSRAATDSRAQP